MGEAVNDLLNECSLMYSQRM